MISNQVRQFFAKQRQAQVSLPSRSLVPVQHTCQATFLAPNHLRVKFPADADPLSTLDLDLDGAVFCFCSGADTVYHLYARIDEVPGERELILQITEATAYPQRRRFFRVDAEVKLRCWLTGDDDGGEGKLLCEVKKQRVNLSAVGLRFSIDHPLRQGEKVRLEIYLPREETGPVRGIGRVVRTGLNVDQVREVAIDLVEILPEEQEKLIKFCLAEQRRQIRLKVQILGAGIV